MSVSAKFFTEILEEEIKLWQESAVRCDSVIVSSYFLRSDKK